MFSYKTNKQKPQLMIRIAKYIANVLFKDFPHMTLLKQIKISIILNVKILHI